MISNRFVSPVFNARKVFFEAGVKGGSSFPDAELSAFGATDGVHSIVCHTVELLRDVHLGLTLSYPPLIAYKRDTNIRDKLV